MKKCLNFQIFLLSSLFFVNFVQSRTILALSSQFYPPVFHSNDYGMEIGIAKKYRYTDYYGIFYEHKFINFIGLRLGTGYSFFIKAIESRVKIENYIAENKYSKKKTNIIWKDKVIILSLDARLYPFFRNYCIFIGYILDIFFEVKSEVTTKIKDKEINNNSIDRNFNSTSKQLSFRLGCDYTMNCGPYFGCGLNKPIYIKGYIDSDKDVINKNGLVSFFIVLGFDISKLI